MIPFFGLVHFLAAALLLAAYASYFRNRSKKTILVLAFLIASLLISKSYSTFIASSILDKGIVAVSVNYLSELGSPLGISLFMIMLAFFGAAMLWRAGKKEMLHLLLILLGIIVISFFSREANAYLNIVFCIFAGSGFVKLFSIRWDLQTIKGLSVILVVCGLIFPTISMVKQLSKEDPVTEYVQSFKWLKSHSTPDDIVLTAREYGFWVEYYSQRHPFIDMNTKNDIRFIESQTMLQSRDLETTAGLMQKNRIKYVWINDKMRQGLVWNKDEQGLLFLFLNRETFRKVYSEGGVEIWEVSLNSKI